MNFLAIFFLFFSGIYLKFCFLQMQFCCIRLDREIKKILNYFEKCKQHKINEHNFGCALQKEGASTIEDLARQLVDEVSGVSILSFLSYFKIKVTIKKGKTVRCSCRQ